MGLVGCACIDELAITRDGAKITATISDISYIDFFLGGVPVAISPNHDQILIKYYYGKNYIRSAVETITEVHEYQIDPELHRVKMLKFSFTDQERLVTDQDIKPVITRILRHGTALAVAFTGAFDEMTNDVISRHILSNYAAFTHLGVKYHYTKICLRNVTMIADTDDNGVTKGYQSTYGVIVLYTSIDIPSEKDMEIAKRLMIKSLSSSRH